jgi:hypothetical protein
MGPLAHHAGEQSLLQWVLLGSGALPLMVAIGRARVAAARARLAGRRRARAAARPPGPDRR